MVVFVFICTVLASLVVYYIIFQRQKLSKLDGKVPPGPWEFPIIGSVLHMNWKNPLMTFHDVSVKYGPVCKLKIGFDTNIIISDFKLAKKMFATETAFTGRFIWGDNFDDVHTNGKSHGIFRTEGKLWEDLRGFTIRQLQDSKDRTEDLIMTELKEVIDWMKSYEGKVIDGVYQKMILSTVNNLWTFIAGERFNHDDPKLLHLAKTVTTDFVEAFDKGQLAYFLPATQKIMPEWSGYNLVRKNANTACEIMTSIVNKNRKTYNPEHQRDYIDAFLKQIEGCTNSKSAFYKDVGEHQIIGVLRELFLAGTETTSNTLEWTFLFCCTFPQVQKELHKELDEVVGNFRHCSLEDRKKMPYSQAFMAEVMRFSTIVPSGVPHRALSDQVVDGWAIPEGSPVYVNTYGIHYSKEIWGDPENFRPERFLSPDGKTYKKNEAVIPFSIGRRECAGKPFAKDSFFLYMTNIFQRFEVFFDPNDPMANPGLTSQPGMFLRPKPFKMIFKERH